MNGPNEAPPGGVPTLTEVVAWPAPAAGDVNEPSTVAMPLDELPGAPMPDVPDLADPVSAQVAEPISTPVYAPVPAPESVPAPMPAPAPMVAAAPPALPPGVSEEQLVQRVLSDVQRQIDLMLDYRLREILTPILTRAADGVIREARAELASTLRDVVTRAVAQELARHRTR